MAAAAGGATNHRHGLFDAVLIKNNHITAAGGVRRRSKAAKAFAGPVEIEVRTRAELDEALACGAKHLLLDNLTPAEAAEWIRYIDGRATVELSGGINLETVRAYAEAGPDFISCGSHHSLGHRCRHQLSAGTRAELMPLDIEQIREARPGSKLHYFSSIGSTMHEAARAWPQPARRTEPSWFADEQTAGIGRLGRSWHSEADAGIYCSVLLRLRLPPGEASLATLLLGLATRKPFRKPPRLPAICAGRTTF